MEEPAPGSLLIQEAYPLPFPWRGVLNWTRTAVGVLCLAHLLAASDPVAYGKAGILAAYLVFAAAVALKFPWLGRGSAPGISLLPLLFDLSVFLAYMVLDPVQPWLAILFCVYVLLAAALRYTWREVALVTACAAVVTVLRPPAVRNALVLPVLAAGAAAVPLALHSTRVQSRMSLSLRQAVLYRAEAERARESERQRIAADFHDGPLQSFVGFQMRLEILRRLLNRDMAQALAELASLQDLCRSQVGELRRGGWRGGVGVCPAAAGRLSEGHRHRGEAGGIERRGSVRSGCGAGGSSDHPGGA